MFACCSRSSIPQPLKNGSEHTTLRVLIHLFCFFRGQSSKAVTKCPLATTFPTGWILSGSSRPLRINPGGDRDIKIGESTCKTKKSFSESLLQSWWCDV